MIVGSTPYNHALNIYSTLKTSTPIKSTLKSVGDDVLELSAFQIDQNKTEDKNAGVNRNKKENKSEEQQKQQQNLNDQMIIAEMQKVDRSVTAHEQAHKAVAGPYAGPISYDYATGPDGKRYVVSGEVPINAPQGRTPEETIQIMERVKRAALAPSDPSAQDVAVAALAAEQQQAARAEVNKQSDQNTEYQNDYFTSFPLKGKITQISDYNPYSQPVESVEEEKPADNKDKKKLGELEALTRNRRSQINQASMNLASQATLNNQNSNNNDSGSNLVSFEKLKALLQQQREYSGHMFIILDIVA